MYALKNSVYFNFQDVNINKIVVGLTDSIHNNPYHFDTFLPQTLTLWLVRTYGLFSTQSYHRDSMQMCKENDPRMDQTGYMSSLMDHCLFRCSCLTGMEQAKHESDPSFKHIFTISSFVKSKGKRTPFHPNCLVWCACAGPHVTHSSGRRTTVLKIAPNFTSSWEMESNSINRRCYPSVIAYFHRGPFFMSR